MKKISKKNKLFAEEGQWYIITIVSGNEDSVIKNLKGKIHSYGLGDLIKDIKVIRETVVTEEIFSEDDLPSTYGRKQKNVEWQVFKDANGKNKYKKIKTAIVNKFYGYIFIKMIMTDEAWYAIRNTTLITGIVGSSGKNAKPIPVGDDEINSLLNVTEPEDHTIIEGSIVTSTEDEIIVKKIKFSTNLSVGQNIIIINGNMKDQKGTIVKIDEYKGVAEVLINIFGRDTNTEVSFEDIELDNK